MSHAVARSQTGAKSKECTLFFTLRAILQSPQPKSATTKEVGLKKRKQKFIAFPKILYFCSSFMEDYSVHDHCDLIKTSQLMVLNVFKTINKLNCSSRNYSHVKTAFKAKLLLYN